jgi:hypothetical protein
MENTEEKWVVVVVTNVCKKCNFIEINMEENSEKNWKIEKKIVKRYGKYERKVS